jgi:hypothetical protein
VVDETVEKASYAADVDFGGGARRPVKPLATVEVGGGELGPLGARQTLTLATESLLSVDEKEGDEPVSLAQVANILCLAASYRAWRSAKISELGADVEAADGDGEEEEGRFRIFIEGWLSNAVATVGAEEDVEVEDGPETICGIGQAEFLQER